jgi:hypothetical protein
MTTAADINGVRRSDPLYAQPAAATEDEDWSGWERWMEGHKAALLEIVGEVIGETTGRLGKRIRELEIELAQTRGALDILRAKGVPGALRVCGTYNPRSAYCFNDIVALNGGSFVARKDNPGECPGDDWQMIARQGQRGVAGERGPAGPAGRDGAPSINIRGWKIDRATYTAVPVLSDGTLGPVLELRGLFEQFSQDA